MSQGAVHMVIRDDLSLAPTVALLTAAIVSASLMAHEGCACGIGQATYPTNNIRLSSRTAPPLKAWSGPC